MNYKEIKVEKVCIDDEKKKYDWFREILLKVKTYDIMVTLKLLLSFGISFGILLKVLRVDLSNELAVITTMIPSFIPMLITACFHTPGTVSYKVHNILDYIENKNVEELSEKKSKEDKKVRKRLSKFFGVKEEELQDTLKRYQSEKRFYSWKVENIKDYYKKMMERQLLDGIVRLKNIAYLLMDKL